MICIKTEIPEEICEIDDELKAIYHSKDTICIWVLKTREDNKFVDDTVGMKKDIDKFTTIIFTTKHIVSYTFLEIALEYLIYKIILTATIKLK